jgi:Outer membrane protein beta-barrel domain
MLVRPIRHPLTALIAIAALASIRGSARAQAVEEPVEPTTAEVPLPPPPRIAVFAIGRGSYRLPPAGSDVGPVLGFGIGFGGEYRYAHLWEILELGASLDLGYLRHSKGVTGVRTGPGGVEETFSSTRLVEDSQFVVMQTAALRFETQHRFWVGGGVGLAIGSFHSDEKSLRPGDARAKRIAGRFAAGYEYDLSDETFVGARMDYSLMLMEPTYKTATSQSLSVFGDTFTFGLTVGSRFE